MKQIKFPVTRISGGGGGGGGIVKINIDLRLYTRDAITNALYKYTDKYYIHQETDSQAVDSVAVIFESKGGDAIVEEEIKSFCNDLIDQQVRVYVSNKFGKIRDLIVEEAFKPVSREGY